MRVVITRVSGDDQDFIYIDIFHTRLTGRVLGVYVTKMLPGATVIIRGKKHEITICLPHRINNIT